VLEIAERICDALGKPRSLIRFVDDRPGQVDRHIGSTDKAERLLGFRAQIDFDQGLERTIAWYRENPAWWASHAAAGAVRS
jgi:dTDP-glucose 4,6-dehydratase